MKMFLVFESDSLHFSDYSRLPPVPSLSPSEEEEEEFKQEEVEQEEKDRFQHEEGEEKRRS
jgi:hypothetical protein